MPLEQVRAVTLAEAIRLAHARGDTEERNRLMAEAHSHATVRDLADLLGLSLSTTHKHLLRGQRDTNVGSWGGRILLENAEIAPRVALTTGGRGPEPLGGPEHG